MTSAVLDASAVLAVLNAEPGADVVRGALAGAVMSTINYSEVLKKASEKGGEIEKAQGFVRGLCIAIIPFDDPQAVLCAKLYGETKQHGLSFADRACLSLTLMRSGCAFTAEREWPKIALPIKIRLIRNAN